MHKTLIATIALFLLAPAAWAQAIYSPDHCSFQIDLPEEPYTAHKCEPSNPDSCFEVASYTHVFSMDTSLRVDIICNPVTESIAQHYTIDVMKSTLKAMMDKDVIRTHETFGHADDDFKQATLIGEGLQGKTPTLFIAQLWIDEKSAFSIQAAIVGKAIEEADNTFSQILASVDKKPNQAPAAE